MAKEACIKSLVDNGSAESCRYYLARRTVIEMLQDRGYVVAGAEEELRRPLADFRAEFGLKPEAERLRLSAYRASDSSRKIVVIFCEDFQSRKQHMVGILGQIMDREMLDKVILILQTKINSHARKVLDDYPVKTETFPITDLLVNMTKHYLQPKYEILTSEEKDQLLNKYNIQDNQLPRMQGNDAIARYYGLEKGQVIRVSYSGGLTDYMKNYRCVV
ncbi:hypothetical protein ACS0TY_006587 [Phlomoides rotata]